MVIELQPWSTSALMLSAYSESEFDSTCAVWMPRSALASVRPLSEVWLNDLSSKPPESETSHALKSGWLSVGAELLAGWTTGCRRAGVVRRTAATAGKNKGSDANHRCGACRLLHGALLKVLHLVPCANRMCARRVTLVLARRAPRVGNRPQKPGLLSVVICR